MAYLFFKADLTLADCAIAIACVLVSVLLETALLGRSRSIACNGQEDAVTKLLPFSEMPDTDPVVMLLNHFDALATQDPELRVDAATCRRFLRARKKNVAVATIALQKYLDWRKNARPAESIADDIKIELASGKGYTQGDDLAGHPMMWAFAGRHDKSQRDIEETVKLILYNMESALATGEKCGVDKICLVFDLSGFGYKSMDYEVTNRLFQLLADFYPERLGRLLLWNAPRMFSAFWPIVSQVFDPVTFRKIQFVHGAGLLDFVAHDSLPE
mmetsp:Transcript_42528/g.113661  ORF Transcript_42528/g.113661 Transcript_42528/m.113661 type:complete len:272 (+) Transcript_42528:1-816(+)